MESNCFHAVTFVCLLESSMRVIKISILILVFVSFFCEAQNSHWQNFGVKEGLPQSHITSITQDSTGYLWLGTNGSGLVRFDGATFNTFQQKDSLPSNFITDLFYARDTLFIGTRLGAGIYANGKILKYDLPETRKIISIKQQIYFATQSGIYLWKNSYLAPLKTIPQIDVKPINDLVYFNNSYWIACKQGLWLIDNLENAKEIKKVSNGNFSSFLVHNNNLYVSKVSEGIFQVNKERITVRKRITSLYKVFKANNTTYALLNNEKALELTPDFSIINSKTTTENNQNIITDIFTDSHKNTWITTKNQGLFKQIDNTLSNYPFRENRIHQLKYFNDSLWIITQNGLYKKSDSSFVPFSFNNQLKNSVQSIAIDSFSNIWAGTKNNGLLLYRKKKDSTSTNYQLIDIGKEIPSIDKNITSVLSINQNEIWLTDTNGIHKLTTQNGIVLKVNNYSKKDGIRDLHITSILQHNNQLWYATKNGNIGFIENNQVTDYHRILGFPATINAIKIYGNTIFLSTSENGIWTAPVSNPKEITPLSGKKQLNSQNCRSLLLDSNNYLWIGTEKGLNKALLDKNNTIQEIYFFDKNDGLVENEIITEGIIQDNTKNIWLSTNYGLTKLSETTSFKQTIKPKISLENVEVVYSKIDTINFSTYTNQLQLKPSQNHISFQFTSVDLNYPKTIEYSWKLTDDFSPWTAKNNVDFANLSYGEYTFEVKSRNRNWQESKPVLFRFVIEKPWYLKWWFLSTTTLILLISISLIIWSYTRKIKRKNQAKIEKLHLENKLLSLEQKALQLQMNPHFVFNVLNSIKAMGTSNKLDKMNETINSFAKLLRGVLQNSREEYISIQQEIEVLENYLKLEQVLSNDKFDYFFHVELSSFSFDELLIPPMIIQPFVENAIKHGFNGIKQQGIIDISFVVSNDMLICKIQDNGVGYETSLGKKKNQHQSIAINVTKERLKSISDKCDFDIVEIKENKKTLGTLVKFQIPYKTDY